MALIIEVVEVADGIFEVRTTHIDESEHCADWDAVCSVADPTAEEAFNRLEIRDLLHVLLARTNLTESERRVVQLFLQDLEFHEIAKLLGLSRQAIQDAFKRAVAKFRKTAKALGIKP